MAADDRLLIHDLTVDCIVGDLPHERERPQRILLDLELTTDCAAAAASDALADAVNWVEVAETATRIAVEGRFHLVETLADRVAATLCEVAGVQAVSITVRKPSALPAASWAGVQIRRERKP